MGLSHDGMRQPSHGIIEPIARYSKGTANRAETMKRCHRERVSCALRCASSSTFAAVTSTARVGDPAPVMACFNADTRTRAGSYTMVAFSVVRLTEALVTPASLRSARSMAAEQAAHVMPRTGITTVLAPDGWATPYPAFSMEAFSTLSSTRVSSYSTVSFSVAGLTAAEATPSSFFTERATAIAHAAQVIPVISRSFVFIYSSRLPPRVAARSTSVGTPPLQGCALILSESPESATRQL